jgi:formylmethanofuran dehydrogenase subunit B
MTAPAVIDHVTCLGCGCACDDIGLGVRDGRIVEARNACALGVQWFGDGQVSSRSHVDGSDVPLSEAVIATARLLIEAERPLVYLAPNASCEAQRYGAAIADMLNGRLDSVTSVTCAQVILSSQERGFASSTLGEISNRADLVVFWGVDIAGRYPRFTERYAPDPIGTHVPEGRGSRIVVAIDVGGATSAVSADHRIAIEPANELATLAALAALALAGSATPVHATLSSAPWQTARELTAMLFTATYVALVYDAEPDERTTRSPQRFDALGALGQALNATTRCAAIALRAGGNRSGADSVLTSQTGYPFAVDFARGYPRYAPHDGSALPALQRGDVDVALVLGDAELIPTNVRAALNGSRCAVIGPGASGMTLGSVIAIDTGVVGIHDDGTVLRTDDVPLHVRASLQGPPSLAGTAQALAELVRRQLVSGVSAVGTARSASS